MWFSTCLLDTLPGLKSGNRISSDSKILRGNRRSQKPEEETAARAVRWPRACVKRSMEISMIPAPVSLLCFPNWRVEAESLRTLKQLAIAAVTKTGRKTTAPAVRRSWNLPNYALTAGNPSLTPTVRLRECSRPSERPTGSILLILGNQIYRNSNSTKRSQASAEAPGKQQEKATKDERAMNICAWMVSWQYMSGQTQHWWMSDGMDEYLWMWWMIVGLGGSSSEEAPAPGELDEWWWKLVNE